MTNTTDGAAANIEKRTMTGDEAQEILKQVKDNAKWVLAEELPAVLEQYDKLWVVEDEETDPYKTKYEARDLLEPVLKKLEQYRKRDGDDESGQLGERIADLYRILGKNYHWTEEVPSAEARFLRALREYYTLDRKDETAELFSKIQDCLNQLGMVWVARGNGETAMNFLRRAQVMYLNRPRSIGDDKICENFYTLTQFYLAQSYGQMSNSQLSAKYCAETLARQLAYNYREKKPEGETKKDEENKTEDGSDLTKTEAASTKTGSDTSAEKKKGQDYDDLKRNEDPFEVREWIRNCSSLADYFTNDCRFWTAEYCMTASLVLAEKVAKFMNEKKTSDPGFFNQDPRKPKYIDGTNIMCVADPDEMCASVQKDMSNLYNLRLQFSKQCMELGPENVEAIFTEYAKAQNVLNTEEEEKDGSQSIDRKNKDGGVEKKLTKKDVKVKLDFSKCYVDPDFLTDQEKAKSCNVGETGTLADNASRDLLDGLLKPICYDPKIFPEYISVTEAIRNDDKFAYEELLTEEVALQCLEKLKTAAVGNAAAGSSSGNAAGKSAGSSVVASSSSTSSGNASGVSSTTLISENLAPQAAIKMLNTGAPGVLRIKDGLKDGVQQFRYVQIAVFFPQLHDAIEAKLNTLNKDFLKARRIGDKKIYSSLSLATGVNYGPAKEIWKLANHYATIALEHYELDGWCTDHVKLLQEISTLYRHLSAWETDPTRLSAMLTRRHKMLAPLIPQLSRQHFLNMWRQLTFETGEIYMELAELNLSEFERNQKLAVGGKKTDGTPLGSDDMAKLQEANVKAAQKVNQYVLTCRSFFQKFCLTYDEDKKIEVNKMDEDNARSYVFGKLNQARMASKFVGLDKTSHIEMLKTAILEFEAIKKWFDAGEVEFLSLSQEKELVREMCALLPTRLERSLKSSDGTSW